MPELPHKLLLGWGGDRGPPWGGCFWLGGWGPTFPQKKTPGGGLPIQNFQPYRYGKHISLLSMGDPTKICSTLYLVALGGPKLLGGPKNPTGLTWGDPPPRWGLWGKI